ncbi:glycosyl transferase [Bacillus cereus]|uniref:glycosyltransferase n=1 Tax=Bacillus sp. AW TaxID=2293329 RepID=UPI000BF907FE|nr:glycosyltransferase [Bacillus wiedmannii]PFI47444.1 glycosyl transferase [Bacillus cereus]RFB70550.1 glycosyltransferase [Bacillus sp. AW]PFQ94737.1 glycosyl transferase [Bacillus cereus]PGP34911.1 glycosyl transferase [Bacillus cereus]
MRVLQINSVCGVGSTGRIATDINKILKYQGHESYIAFGRGDARECDTTIRIGNQVDNYIHVAKTRILDKHGFSSKQATQKFINEIEKLNPDIIHLHNIHGYYINVEILFEYLKKTNKPVVWTLHDCWAFTGHCSYFDYVECNRWKTGCYSCPQKKNYPGSILIDNSRHNYLKKKELFKGVPNMTIVTPSNWLARLVNQSFLGEYNVRVINNGINLEVFKQTESKFREQYNLEGKFIILGVASVWEERKGYKYFLELSKIIKTDEIIVLVGLTNKQVENLPNNIIGITRTNSVSELTEIYSAADVFVNPTLEDNFPTTNLEALACGIPIITFETGGSVECIHNECGFIVEKGNVERLTDAIKVVKEKGKLSYSKECVRLAKIFYDKEDRFNDYIKLYSSILNGN